MALRTIVLLLLLGSPRLVAGEDQGEIGKLVADLGHDEPAVREEASRTLVFYRDRAVPALTAAMKSPDTEVRVRAQQALDAIALDKRIGPSAWVRLPEGESSVVALLLEVARQGNRSFDHGEVVLEGKTYDGPRGWMPIWQAIDRLTRSADCAYELPFDKAVCLAAGPAPKTPAAFDGAIRFEVMGLVEASGDTRDPRPTYLSVLVSWEPHVRLLVDTRAGELRLEESTSESLQPGRPEGTCLSFSGLHHDSGDDCSFGHRVGLMLATTLEAGEIVPHARLRGDLALLTVLDVSEEEVLNALSSHGDTMSARYEKTDSTQYPEGLDFPGGARANGFSVHMVLSADGEHCPMRAGIG